MLGRRREKMLAPALALGVTLVARQTCAETPTDPSVSPPLDPSAAPSASDETEVVVRGRREHERELTREEARELPGAFGDPLRAIEMQPGVSPIATGLPYFYLRGAPPGNIGYFLDGVRVPTLYHLGLGPSVIHPSLIESVALHPGPYPARYGRFGGGVVTAEIAPPASELGGEANVRLVDAGAVVKAPFADYRGSAALGGRYSYTAKMVSLFAPEIDVSYWDYQALVSYDVTPNDTLGVLSFGASDFLSEARPTGIATIYDSEFHRVDARYDRKLGGGATLRVAGTLGADASTLEEGQLAIESETGQVRLEAFAPFGEENALRAGIDAELTRYTTVTREAPDSDLPSGVLGLIAETYGPRRDLTTGAWLDAELTVARGIRLRPGIRVDVFDSDDKTLVGVDPRVQAEFDVSKTVTISEGIGIVHQRPSFTVPLAGVQPELDRLQKSIQASSGVLVRLPNDVKASATGFAALHLDLTDPVASARLVGGDALFYAPGHWLGRSYGLELMIQRSLARKLGGFLAYTLSRSERSLGSVHAPAPFDRTHVVTGAVTYDFGRRWRAGARASVYTGMSMEVAYLEATPDAPRTDAFFRLDWRVEKSWLVGKDASIALVLEVLNTTLQEEAIAGSCSAYVCRTEDIGPVTVPSLGVELAF